MPGPIGRCLSTHRIGPYPRMSPYGQPQTVPHGGMRMAPPQSPHSLSRPWERICSGAGSVRRRDGPWSQYYPQSQRSSTLPLRSASYVNQVEHYGGPSIPVQTNQHRFRLHPRLKSRLHTIAPTPPATGPGTNEPGRTSFGVRCHITCIIRSPLSYAHPTGAQYPPISPSPHIQRPTAVKLKQRTILDRRPYGCISQLSVQMDRSI